MAPDLAHVRVSLVVLNFRTPPDTIASLDSAVAAAGDAQVEAIVVDNASGDGSAELLRSERPWARVVELERNRGFAAGMNAGIAEATGDYVLLLNSDVMAHPGSVGELASYLREHPDVGIAAPVLLDTDGRRSRTLLLEPTPARVLLPWVGKRHYRKWQARLGDRPLEVEATEGAAVMVSRKALDLCGPLDEDFFFYHEIVEWCMRVRDRGLRCVVLPASRMVHACGGSTSGVRRAARIELKRSEYQLLDKRLGVGARLVTVLRDLVSETLSVLFYGMLVLLSLGRLRRGWDKLRVHWPVLAWLALGMPARHDDIYERLFGRWD